MTSAAFSVILPHKRNPGNDAALSIALDCLMTNTVHDFHLLMDAAYDQPLYERVNRMVRQADTEICIYTASDTFMSPGWDVPFLEAVNERTFVTGVLVEPGAISIFNDNVHKDFGRTPEKFQRAEFELWVEQESPALNLSPNGWLAPYAFPRDGWLEYGGLETDLYAPDGFTDADWRLFDRWREAGGQVVRARSFSYHLQRFSDEHEQTKEGR